MGLGLGLRSRLQAAGAAGVDALGVLFPRTVLRHLGRSVYNYHNLGAGVFPPGEEKTPCGSGERYNFDRMYLMASACDFTGKSVVDLGCNSGWFCFQLRLLGAGRVVGIDQRGRGLLGNALRYGVQFERAHRLGVRFEDRRLEEVAFAALARRHGLERFDAALVLSVLHHVFEDDAARRTAFFAELRESVREVIFYEDHEFWNDMRDDRGEPIPVRGEGYRRGWNEDMSWQRRMGSLESHEARVLAHYRGSWRNDVLGLDRFAAVRLLGFSEKRRPVLALFRTPPAPAGGGVAPPTPAAP